jgi:hypothetical protein
MVLAESTERINCGAETAIPDMGIETLKLYLFYKVMPCFAHGTHTSEYQSGDSIN